MPLVANEDDRQKRAARDREALFAAIKKSGKSDRAICRDAGLSQSVLSNYRLDSDKTLSLETWRRLWRVLPDLPAMAVSESRSSGRRMKKLAVPVPPSDGSSILVRVEAAAGLLQPTFDLPASKWQQLSLPVSEADAARGPFGVVVGAPGAEKLYAEGSILVCIPIGAYEGAIKTGLHVILERRGEAGIEVTVRDLVVEANEAMLWVRSTHPDHQVPTRMPYTPGQPLKAWRAGKNRYFVAAVVIAAYVPRA
jgi:hypothetical protein